VGCVALYARSTTGKDRIGGGSLLVISVLLTVMGEGVYLGRPPPSALPGAARRLGVFNLDVVLLDLVRSSRIGRSR
jgi:hypothetical protein